MAHPQIAAFARLADGDAKATRSIAGQNSLITRDIHDMAYNPLTDEIVIPQARAQAIMTYRGGANGDEKPIRVINGPDTQLATPMRLGLDAVHKEIFVPSYRRDEILVFPSDAEGNVAPIRIIKGPDTQLGATALTIDPIHNLLIVAGPRPQQEANRAATGRERSAVYPASSERFARVDEHAARRASGVVIERVRRAVSQKQEGCVVEGGGGEGIQGHSIVAPRN